MPGVDLVIRSNPKGIVAMEYVIIVGLLLIVAAWIGGFAFIGHLINRFDKRCEKSRQDIFSQQIATLPNFTPVLRFDQPDTVSVLFLDPGSKQFAFVHGWRSVRCFSFDQVVAVDVERNGTTLERTNRGSQFVGAAVGGVLLGPVGLLVGGLTGSTRQNERVKRLSLKIVTNDLHEPVIEVVFFHNPKGEKPDSGAVMSAAQQLEQWHGRFRTILLGNERGAFVVPPMPQAAPSDDHDRPLRRQRGFLA